MSANKPLPLFDNLPMTPSVGHGRLILASGSPRRSQLMSAAGYRFQVLPAGDEAECGMCSRETAPQMVARYAFRKAADVATRVRKGFEVESGSAESSSVDSESQDAMIVAADTVASCVGQILGKPHDREHAEVMLRTLSGRKHDVYTGICLWSTITDRCVVDVVRTQLKMQSLTEDMLEDYLDSMLWEGKAGAFGYQDGNDWLEVLDGGSESNVVGLPMERLAEIIANFDGLSVAIESPATQSGSDASNADGEWCSAGNGESDGNSGGCCDSGVVDLTPPGK